MKFDRCKIPQLDVTLLREKDGAFYDGPATYGPREVRQSGRGPYWRGQITSAFARELIRRARKRDIPVLCDGKLVP